jgi:isoleucyl-tRNA synthetase
VAAALVPAVAMAMGGAELDVLLTLQGADMSGWEVDHPLHASFTNPLPKPVLFGDHVTVVAGTGVVHTAPAHGHDDFNVCKEAGIAPGNPVDDAGNFTEEAGRFKGLAALGEGVPAVVAALQVAGALLASEEHVHSYPCDWRTKKPVMTRATEQWFADLTELQPRAIAALDDVIIQPEGGRRRLVKMLASRKEWCISRQRPWGVPIPAFFRTDGGPPLLTSESIAHFEACVAAHPQGADCWWTAPLKDLLPPAMRADAGSYIRGGDTLDVWFDSGTSWFAALQQRLPQHAGALPELATACPATLYCEGADQHRGWFQSSLLTAVACTGRAPYEEILSHGFVLDEHGRKMSKSVGNVLDPALVIDGGPNKKKQPAYGADVLRVWAASTDYTRDIRIGATSIAAASDNLRKLRNTCRFLLGNLADFKPERHAVAEDLLANIDRWMFSKLRQASHDITAGYEQRKLARVVKTLVQLAVVDLSALYFDVAKDRLYCDGTDSHSRRSVQTVLHLALYVLVGGMAPIMPFTAEDCFAHTPVALRPPPLATGAPDSVFCVGLSKSALAGCRVLPLRPACLSGWLRMDSLPPSADGPFDAWWEVLLALRGGVNVALGPCNRPVCAVTALRVALCEIGGCG